MDLFKKNDRIKVKTSEEVDNDCDFLMDCGGKVFKVLNKDSDGWLGINISNVKKKYMKLRNVHDSHQELFYFPSKWAKKIHIIELKDELFQI